MGAARDAGAALRAEVDAVARGAGIGFVGVADTAGVPAPFADYPRAVVAAVPLSRGVLAGCVAEPTREYGYHYRVVNGALDQLACRVAAFLEGRGFATYAVGASHITDWGALTGAVSHPRLAAAAALGRIGRHGMLVTPRFGAGVRLVSVFTTAPLPAAAPAAGAGGCDGCGACQRACPAGAIGDGAAAWRKDKCRALLTEFKRRITNQYICGVCVRACAQAAAMR
jgi:epoxyqueuosine reductase QueG